MLLFIKHLTELTYSEPITETVMEVRMTPRNDAHQVRRAFRLEVGPSATPFEHTDWLGNRVQQFSILPPHDKVVILARSVVDTQPRHSVLADVNRGSVPPLDHRIGDYLRFTGPVVDVHNLDRLIQNLGLGAPASPEVILQRVASNLRDHVEYRKGVTTSATAIDKVLEQRAGVCQDLAHVAIGILRKLGVPARYVSGYFYRADGNSEMESHAWCEAHFQGTGWLPIDPTHKTLAGEGHVAIASGRDFSDVSPNRGVYRGKGEESLRVRVTVQEVQEVPEGLFAVGSPEVEVQPIGGGMLPTHREALEYQQEQQQQQQQQQQVQQQQQQQVQQHQYSAVH
ncbi:MAG: transglutaminase family protein [Polyangiaceae bacterium]|nr:transglutaminase family protein [Polyangiaceae bacterium]